MTPAEIKYRLDEIAETSLQDLDDQAVLALLTERKELLVQSARLEEQEKEQAEKLKQAEAKKDAIKARIAEINSSITPDQEADQLLALIQERKTLEGELKTLESDDAVSGEEKEEVSVAEEPTPKIPKARKSAQDGSASGRKKEIVKEPEPVLPESVEEPVEEEKEEVISAEPEIPESKPVVPEVLEKPEPEIKPEAATPSEPEPESAEVAINSATPYTETYTSKMGKVSALEASPERMVLDSTLQTSEYQGYLSELKANLNSLGTFLQTLPVEVKRNRAFMLEVAKIDPAYAMHYADKDTLKKDESFNVAVAGINNQRNTGNPLSEMLPEMRTGAVILVGVKNDFRNVRFVKPEMPEYESIMELAKKGALESMQALQGAHNVQQLIPPILQKDKAFMAEVEKLTS